MMLAAAVNLEAGVSRAMHLFDVFGSVPDLYYGPMQQFLLDVTEQEVLASFELFGLAGPHIHLHKGLVNETVPWVKDGSKLGPIAILRIDLNSYGSCQLVLCYLYEHVPVGGIVIFDDVRAPSALAPAVTSVLLYYGQLHEAGIMSVCPVVSMPYCTGVQR